jgi:Family of unknown function (DUF6194)
VTPQRNGRGAGVAGHGTRAIDPEEILSGLLGCDPALRLERYWGERSLFYNPGRDAPLGVIWVSLKDHDGENDRSAALSRDGVYRFAFQLARDEYERRFGPPAGRPPKGGVIDIPGYDPTRLDELMPHPVYGWMTWVQILSPTTARFESLRPLLADSLDMVRRKWDRRKAR